MDSNQLVLNANENQKFQTLLKTYKHMYVDAFVAAM